MRLVGESWPLSRERATIESAALALHGRLCPNLVPKLLHFDPIMFLIIMEDLRDAVILRKVLVAGRALHAFAAHIAEFLAHTHFKSCDLFLSSAAKKQAVVRFTNTEMCALTEDVVFTAPFTHDAPTNRHNSHISDALIARLRTNALLLAEVRWLKWAFMTRAEALLHGDLHTGSVMVTDSRTYIIDAEFAFYGPMGFDIGAVLGNLLIAYASQLGHITEASSRARYQQYILQTVADVWTGFAAAFDALWRTHDPHAPAHFRSLFLHSLLRDTIGFAGVKMIRRVLGIAHVLDLESIGDERVRAQAESLVLEIAEALLLKRHNITDIQEVLSIARETRVC